MELRQLRLVTVRCRNPNLLRTACRLMLSWLSEQQIQTLAHKAGMESEPAQ